MPYIGLGTWGSDWGVTFGVSGKNLFEFNRIVSGFKLISNEKKEPLNRL